MRKTAFVIAILLLAGLATAQTMIPLPAFGRTYSSSMTRGFYCLVPTDCEVTGLRVPDEANDGTQNVCLYKHTSAPPAYSGTVLLTPAFFKFGEPSANVIPCSVKYTTGDYLIVIGACGGSTGLKNSYAGVSGGQASNILGVATTLYRCGIQSNLTTMAPPHPLWSENAGSISRVEVYVTAAGGANLAGQGTPKPGNTFTLLLTSANEPGLAYQLGSSFGQGPIPIDTRQIGLSPDVLLFLSTGNFLPGVFTNYSNFLDTAGKATASIVIPNIPSLTGIHIYSAFLTLQASAPSGVASISNTLDMQIQ